MKGLFLPLFFVIVSGGLFFTYIDPTYKDVQVLQAENERFDQALQKSRELQAIRDQLLSRFNTFASSDRARLQKLLPDHIDNVRLILDIDTIAGGHGLSIEKFSFSGDQQSSQGGGGGNVPNTSSQGATAQLANDPFAFDEGMGDGSGGGASVSQELFRSMTMSFTVTARYEVFLDFLRDLERSLRVADIISLDVKPGDSASAPYEFSVTIQTYWLP